MMHVMLLVLATVIAALCNAQELPPPLLPVPRPLAQVPNVSQVGDIVAHDGTVKSLSLSATLAVSDLRMYDYQLGSLFPRSADYAPVDSLRRAKVARATAWLARLNAVPGADIRGRQLVDLAEVAMRAEQDSMVYRLIDLRLAGLPAGRAGYAQRSYALAAGITLLTDPAQDSARLVRNLAVADRYAAVLSAIPAGGYATHSDSTDVLYRQLHSERSLLLAAESASLSERVITYAGRMVGVLRRLDLRARRDAVSMLYPYREVATALVNQVHGLARLDSLQGELLGLVDETRGAQGSLREQFASFALLGHPAPQVMAHAWLNMPDSMYTGTPTVHSFADGTVRVLAITSNDNSVLPVLDRLHRQLPAGVQVLLITETDGHIGPDIATPAEEVAWISKYYHSRRHFTFPVALWAGAKVPGPYGSMRPQPSGIGGVYYAGALEGLLILVDGHGIVRGYEAVRSRPQEAHLIRHVRALLAEGQH